MPVRRIWRAGDVRVAEIRRLFRARDMIGYRSVLISLHEDVFTVSGYPRLVGLVQSIQQILFRYSVLFIDRDPSRKSRDHELDLVTMRVQHLRDRNVIRSGRGRATSACRAAQASERASGRQRPSCRGLSARDTVTSSHGGRQGLGHLCRRVGVEPAGLDKASRRWSPSRICRYSC